MRFLLLIACFYWSSTSIGQTNGTDKLKLSISFGNSVQMAFDVVDRKHNFNTEVDAKLENGDNQYYRSHYKRAVDYYRQAFEALVGTSRRTGPIDVFSISQKQDDRFTTDEKLLKQIGTRELNRDQWLDLASVINNLGIYNQQIGNLRVAEKLFLKALEIRGKEAGKTSEYYVASLHNLAGLRADQGRYNAAEDMLKYVIKYYEKKRSSNSYQYAIALNNQAMLNVQLGRMEEATSIFNETLNNSSISFPEHSLDRARIMANKALVELENENVETAADLLSEALIVFEKKGATKHSDYYQIRLILAQVYLKLGRLAFLDEFIEGSLKEIGKDTETDNLSYSYALEIKAEYFLTTKKYQQAYELFQQIANIRASKLGTLHKDYLRTINKLAISQWRLGQNQRAFESFKKVTTSYIEVVDQFFYNMSDKEKAKFWQTLKPELDVFYSFTLQEHKSIPELLPLAYHIRIKTKGLLLHNSSLVRDAIYGQSNDDLTKKYEDWRSIKELLSGYYSMDKEAIETIGIDVNILESESNDLEKELNRLVSEGLLEDQNVTYQMIEQALKEDQAAIEIMRVSNQHSESTTIDQYVAFVVTKNQALRLVTIGEAQELESKMSVYYKNAVKNKVAESLTYQKFWSPIQGAIENVEQIYISLDGVYNLINLNSLKNENNQYLLDLLKIQIVPNTKLIATKPVENESNSEVLLIGNPSFADASIDPLPGTAMELTAIQNLFNSKDTRVLSKELATEESLKKIERPKVLHIATHGFFLDEANTSTSLTITRSISNSNPLMRSGLLLSGAGKSPSRELNENISDGIFTAYEAMNLNLKNTDLVILSACETGNGEVVNGEGVYGLSRAFTIAGTRNLIMSLWKVDDQATMELMTFFYKYWLLTKDLKSAFINAQKQVRAKYSEPYYWASFVLISNE